MKKGKRRSSNDPQGEVERIEFRNGAMWLWFTTSGYMVIEEVKRGAE